MYNIYRLHTKDKSYYFYQRAKKQIDTGPCGLEVIAQAPCVKRPGINLLNSNKNGCVLSMVGVADTIKKAIARTKTFKDSCPNTCVNYGYDKHTDDAKSKRSQHNKAHYRKHKDAIIKRQRATCVCDHCGRTVRKYYLKTHKKSKVCRGTYLKYTIEDTRLTELCEDPFHTLPLFVRYDHVAGQLIADTRKQDITQKAFDRLCSVLVERALALL